MNPAPSNLQVLLLFQRMVDLISIGHQNVGIVPEKFLWMVRFSGTAVVVENYRGFLFSLGQ